jgi:phosphopantothenoylcysteine decarboxylase/phosphopantothenate--cysteine ligase
MKVLLGVCGSIAAYKTFDLVRSFVNNGHEVKVVLSRGANEFVKAQVYKYLGAKEVYNSSDDFNYPVNENQVGTVLHIELAKWADKFVIAPLSANTLSKFAYARADDLLSSIFLAIDQEKPILLFPAMNTKMLEHPFVKENFELVKKVSSLSQVEVFGTISGELACGDIGLGKLASIESILTITESFSAKNLEKKIVITTGATISPLDPVRYLTNASSGKTGFELSKSLLEEGYLVSLIAGKNATTRLEELSAHPNFSLKRVITTNDMHGQVHEEILGASAYISAAAISDIEFSQATGKLKKSSLTESIDIKKSHDVLQSVLEKKDDSLKVIGFAAETDLSLEVLQEKWNRKKVDLLVGTHVHSGLTKDDKATSGFANDSANYSLMKEGQVTFEGYLSKRDLAKKISLEVING